MEETSTLQLKVWDYVSMSCVVALSSAVGIYYVFAARKIKTTSDFLVTSKDLGLFPLILSSVATFWSAIGMLSFPNETYMNGLSYGVVIVTYIGANVLGYYLFLPVFFKLNKDSIFEYLELRFNKTIRICTSLMLTLQTILYTSVVMYAPALALNQVTGLHLWGSVICIGIACIIYTSMGGIKAVVWADVTQCLVMLGVYMLIIVKGTIDVGGISVAWERFSALGRTQIFVWSSNSQSNYTFWSNAIGCSFHVIPVILLNQGLMQRYLSNKTLKRARLTLFGSTVGFTIGQIVFIIGGILSYAYYYDCDPLLGGKIKYRDQTMALYGVNILSFAEGLPGIFVAGVMCATLSTLSSTLNYITTLTISDYVMAYKPDLSNETSKKLSKIIAVFYGILCVALVAWVENMGGVAKATFSISGMTGGPILVVFTIGMLFPWVNTKGATAAFVGSIILPLWAWIGNMTSNLKVPHFPLRTDGCSNETSITNVTMNIIERSTLEEFYASNSFWYVCWSLISGTIIALVFTKFISSQDPHQVDPDLLFPFMRNYMLKMKEKANTVKKNYEQADVVSQYVSHPLLTSNKEIK